MLQVIPIYKPICLTPLQAIIQFKQLRQEYSEATISYAGRLDPMAEGLLLLLVNEENKKRKQYEDLEKTYEFSLLLGIATDTYDLLGKITEISRWSQVVSPKEHRLRTSTSDIRLPFELDMSRTAKRIASVLPTLTGDITLPYPPYSSKSVNGKPLFWYARKNKLDGISIPTRTVHISSLRLLSSTLFPAPSLLSYISRFIPETQGDFRQREILALWQSSSSRIPAQLPLLSLRTVCSSGTYVRQIVYEIGKMLGIPSVTFSIKRTKIGEYTLEDAMTCHLQSESVT